MNKIEFGDCKETMRRWASEGIKAQTCVTSPPYYGLRDYGTAKWEGGDPNCEHSISMPTKWNDPKRGVSVLRPEVAHRGGSSKKCHQCGALRIDSQIGLEETPEKYIANMVEVFRCVRDVLADDGTVWLNIGDSYNAAQSNRTGQNGFKDGRTNKDKRFSVGGVDGLKPKDLIGIPWMLAFALRADGWYLRQDIIWHKPNPMPESVRDRCTKAHEYIFLLSKSQKYYYDSEAIRENSVDPVGSANRYKTSFFVGEKHESGGYSANGAKHTGGMKEFDGKRNRRSVWTVSTRPYKGAHFATFPTALIEPCILAGSRTGDIVLDPFMGSGTTAQVSLSYNRKYLGCELNESYKELQEKRINNALDLFNK